VVPAGACPGLVRRVLSPSVQLTHSIKAEVFDKGHLRKKEGGKSDVPTYLFLRFFELPMQRNGQKRDKNRRQEKKGIFLTIWQKVFGMDFLQKVFVVFLHFPC
jgi:hypothetical protein